MRELLFSIAVYGPFIGFLATGGFKRRYFSSKGANTRGYYVILVPLVMVIPVIVLSFIISYYDEGILLGAAATSVRFCFLSNFIPSGTEEFRWRGVLYPELKDQGRSFWDIAWKGGTSLRSGIILRHHAVFAPWTGGASTIPCRIVSVDCRYELHHGFSL